MDRLLESVLNAAALRPDDLIGQLTYINYATNRDRSPEISPERWARIYPNAAAMEAKYRADKWIASLTVTSQATMTELGL